MRKFRLRKKIFSHFSIDKVDEDLKPQTIIALLSSEIIKLEI